MSKWKYLIFAILIASSACVMAQERNEKASLDLFQQGMRAYNNGQYDFAVASFEKALTNDKLNGLTYLYLGLSELKLKNYTEALNMLSKGQNLDESMKQNVDFLLGMGETHAGLGNYDLAEKYFRMALAIDTRSSAAYYKLGQLVYMEGRNDTTRANEIFDTCMMLDPKMLTRFLNVAESYARLGDHSRAIEQYIRVMRYADDPIVFYNAATQYFKSKDYEHATVLYQRTIEMIKHNPELKVRCYTAIGNCQSRLQRYESAISAYKEAVAMDYENVNATLGIANAYHQLDNREEARKWFTRAAELGSSDAQNFLNFYTEEDNP